MSFWSSGSYCFIFMSIILLITILFCLGIQVVFWISASALKKYKPEPYLSTAKLPFVSVVIAAKDECVNLQENLLPILLQNYPEFEVIIINDHSTDQSIAFLHELRKKHTHLRFNSLPWGQKGKKAALTMAVEMSKSEWIVVIDADCYPASALWLQLLLNKAKGYDVCLGYGAYESSSTLLNAFIRYEAWYVSMQFFTLAANNKAYMGVGRNMAYKKQLFTDVGGFDTLPQILSGDDDLFISSLPPDTRFTLSIDPNSFTYSSPKKSFWSFYKQKWRHITTSVYYKKNIKLLLLLLHFGFLGFYILVFLCFICYSKIIAIVLLFGRSLFMFLYGWTYLKMLSIKISLPALLLIDLGLALFYILLSPMIFLKRNSW